MIDWLCKIRVHPLFWVIMAAGIVTGHLWDTAIAFFIVLVHECGHAAVACLFGWRVIAVELLPFGGVARLDTGDVHPFYQECLVLLAGPLQNAWLPLLSFALSGADFWNADLQQIFFIQNAALLIFNLLPVWPLDGGRLLHVLLEVACPYKKAYKGILDFSLWCLLFFSIYIMRKDPFSLNYWMVLSFIIFSIYKERRALPLRFIRFLLAASEEKTRFPRLIHLRVHEHARLSEVLAMFYKNAEHRIHVIEKYGRELDGRKLLAEYFTNGDEGKPLDRFY